MRTKLLLRIDASIRAGGSHSRALGDYFQERWLERHPGGRVARRDLAAEPVPHLNQATAAVFTGMADAEPGGVSSVALSDALIAELEAADEVLVCSPVYNFNTPSTLKAYVDHVVRFGRTFGMNESGFFGLLRGKSAWLITARGGLDPRQTDCQGPFLRAAFRHMGFERVEWVALEGTTMNEAQQAMARARRQVEAWFEPAPPADGSIEWRGVFSAQDRAEIQALRAAQVRAITSGDAAAYAALCAEDIVLMLQGREMVVGREAFLRCESDLLKTTRFAMLRQIPLRVERDGVLALETGCQESEIEGASTESANYRARRKYTHVLRKTAEGWRFAILMSNNSE